MKYQVKVTQLGDMAQDLMDAGTLIIFNENAPSELSEISVLHTVSDLNGTVEIGDRFVIGSHQYKVLDVGSEAVHTLREMGHCSLKFEGTNAQLPGEIVLDGDMPVVNIGDDIIIE
jgi:PTS system glucitol/sorbitol-specific IIA component